MPPDAIYFNGGALIVVGMLLISGGAVFSSPSAHPWIVGLVMGTMLQQTVLAAAWSAIGPCKLMWRMPLSLVWAGLMGAALEVPLMMGPHAPRLVFIIATSSLWLVGQIPLWLTSLSFGLRLQHHGYPPETDPPKQGQFSTSQLMAFMAFIAVLLAIGRLIVLGGAVKMPDIIELQMMALMFATQMLITLSLLFTALLPKWSWRSSVIGVAIVGIATVIEARILSVFIGEDCWIAIWTNLFGAIWVLIFAAMIRSSYYHFGATK
ncbi:hypothetical protein [Anatilimnocola floriformis]|uniref:hypothetical protein n=1 Tax=Anatilimnocola floriformis TaxID=2948575 RepID=UPI0020C4170D|nr:hypothetical protein [Anatilimnocola floriformis]